MKFVMLSDLHLEGLADPNQERLVRFLDRLEADELVLLGDLFHHWWGFPDVVLSRFVPAAAALLRLRARGVPISMVPGNHDFALGAFFHDTLGVQVRESHLRVLDGVPFVLAHGDEADSRWQVQLSRRLLRGPAFAATIRALGPARGHALLRRLAGASRAHPASQAALVAAQRAWAAARLQEGAAVVVLGHSHAPGETALPGGRLFTMGDWSGTPWWLEVEDGAPRLVQAEV